MRCQARPESTTSIGSDTSNPVMVIATSLVGRCRRRDTTIGFGTHLDEPNGLHLTWCSQLFRAPVSLFVRCGAGLQGAPATHQKTSRASRQGFGGPTGRTRN